MIYACKNAIQDIDFAFSLPEGDFTQEQEEAIDRALYKHMVVGSTLKQHNVACQKCWDYYQEMKRTHCGG